MEESNEFRFPEEDDDVEPVEITELSFTDSNGEAFQCLLYLGARTSVRHLARVGIICVLNVANEIPAMSDCDRESQGVVTYAKLSYPGIFDRASERNAFFDRCYETIAHGANAPSAEQKRAMVHCKFGLNRAATVSIAVTMRASQCTLASAYNLVKSKRPTIVPFPHELLDYEKKLYGKNSISSNEFK